MKKIRLLNVIFDAEIMPHELPAFRGAINEKVGKESILFHHHLDDDEKKFLYRYPLIQYKIIGKKPAIVCIEEGVDEIHKFFQNRSWDIEISGRHIPMKVASLNLNSFNMQVWNRFFSYHIKNWIALNAENYEKYRKLEDMNDKIAMLEDILKANILSFAKGIGWNVDKQIEVKITDLKRINTVRLKEQKLFGFNIQFKTNVFLPNYIGLGKSTRLGFGMVNQKKDTVSEIH